MLFVRIGIASFQCAPTTYVNSINECFSPLTFLHKLLNYFLMFQCNEHVEMSKFLCSLAGTWMAIIHVDSQFYIIDSLSEMFHWNGMLKVWLHGCN